MCVMTESEIGIHTVCPVCGNRISLVHGYLGQTGWHTVEQGLVTSCTWLSESAG